ncbi:metalloproteinase inhibitor 4-like isoform X1 [Mytilus californianus]|uniref:metalloproteinase inhibitor 4-like isoform X1 n=2 Tax=Mytilus californianus TaxID=6549 RepID=UPI0022467EA4|nr:metalloproteinase inhibitor 4-like isoform X1 [Mytilus californianus]
MNGMPKKLNMDSDLLTKILIVVSSLSAVYGCSCLKGHHQEDFCRAAYVIRGDVIDSNAPVKALPGNQQRSIIYTVKVKKVFKDNTHSISEGNVINIETSIPCSITLDKNVDYLLGGPGDENGLGIGTCDIATTWETLPKCQMNSLLNKLYNCGCEITTCTENQICKASIHSCKMAFHVEAVQNAYCARSLFRRRCHWKTCPSAQNIFNSYITNVFRG